MKKKRIFEYGNCIRIFEWNANIRISEYSFTSLSPIDKFKKDKMEVSLNLEKKKTTTIK